MGSVFQALMFLSLTAGLVSGRDSDEEFQLGGDDAKEVSLEEKYPPPKRWLEGLSEMSSSHSPDSETWSNSIAICSIMRDENVTDVKEWLEYYQWLGVDHVFLTDNDSKDSNSIENTLKNAFPSDFLTFRTEQTPKAQLKAYAWCASEHREDFNWMAFFDVDEYLLLRDAHAADPMEGTEPDLKGFLDQYKMESGLVVNWIMVGPSGRKTRPEEGGVLKYYDQCVSKADRHIKTIANTWFLDGVATHPHNFHFREGGAPVNEKFVQLNEVWMVLPKNVQPNKWEGSQCEQAFDDKDPKLKAHCYQSASPLFRNGTVDSVALFHFATKSEEDFEKKVERGSGMSLAVKGQSYYTEIQQYAPNGHARMLPRLAKRFLTSESSHAL